MQKGSEMTRRTGEGAERFSDDSTGGGRVKNGSPNLSLIVANWPLI